MMKATLRSAVLLGLVALGMFASSIPSFAEVQSVRVGGDVTVRGFHRENLDLHDEDGALDDTDDFFMATYGVNIAANLTENIEAFLRLANERTLASSNANTAQGDVDISQGYIKVNELFYSPLSVTIGTQPIRWGRGFILGSNLRRSVQAAGDRNASIAADEYTDFTAFDAVRATLNLNGGGAVNLPLSADFVYIKESETTVGLADDVNILGINLGSKFDAMNSEIETYYLNKRDRSGGGGAATAVSDNNGSVNTIGLRGSTQPVEGANVFGEVAYQFGNRLFDPSGILVANDAMQAWAFDLGGEFTFKSVPTTPMVGAEWIFYSGKELNGGVPGWTPIAPGYFTSLIRQYQITGFYPPDQACVRNTTASSACTDSDTNQHELSVYGSLKPIEDLTISPRLSWFVLDEGVTPVAGSKRYSYAGTEWDTSVKYNYTDDVQFGLAYGIFFPGSIYRTAVSATSGDSTAQELISSVSVKF